MRLPSRRDDWKREEGEEEGKGEGQKERGRAKQVQLTWRSANRTFLERLTSDGPSPSILSASGHRIIDFLVSVSSHSAPTAPM